MTNIDKLIVLTTEFEGLLMVLKTRCPEHLQEQLTQKFTELTAEFDILIKNISNDSETASIKHDITCESHEVLQSEVKLEEAEEPEFELETEIATQDIEHQQLKEMEVKEELEDEIIQVPFDEEFPSDSVFLDESEEINREYENLQSEFAETEVVQDNIDRQFKSEQTTNESVTTELNVDQMLSRQEAVNLKKVFTLNDKFRFRRALFNQDDALFAQVLDELGALQTYAEACELAVDKYGWRLDNPDVEDFLSIIKPHYKS